MGLNYAEIKLIKSFDMLADWRCSEKSFVRNLQGNKKLASLKPKIIFLKNYRNS
jgi:hypothetical protein